MKNSIQVVEVIISTYKLPHDNLQFSFLSRVPTVRQFQRNDYYPVRNTTINDILPVDPES